jgi:hypothetical protein
LCFITDHGRSCGDRNSTVTSDLTVVDINVKVKSVEICENLFCETCFEFRVARCGGGHKLCAPVAQ